MGGEGEKGRYLKSNPSSSTASSLSFGGTSISSYDRGEFLLLFVVVGMRLLAVFVVVLFVSMFSC